MAFADFILDNFWVIFIVLFVIGILGKIAESKGYGPNGWRTIERNKERERKRAERRQ